MKNHLSQPITQDGFTLIEFLIYMGILSILIFVLANIFTATLDVKLESEAVAGVDLDGKYILNRLSYDMHQASSIASPSAAGQTSGSLQIVVNSVNYIYTLDGSGNLQLNTNLGVDQMNSINSKISNLTFQRIGNGSNADTILVNFTITSQTQRVSGFESRVITTALSLP